ncbi:MAG TPA: signal peptidase II [Blastocatellia bacterium]|nr:signal peptidase II [Blastocatellia bacterium]
MTNVGRTLLLVALVATTIGCDRVSKHIAVTSLAGTPGRSFFADTVRLEYAENVGGFLSLGANQPPAVRTAIFKIGTGLLLVATLMAAAKLRLTGWPLVGLSLVWAGGASNWVDRVMHGCVVDFLNVGFGALRTGIFNVADVAVMLGACIIAGACRRPNRPPGSDEQRQ